LTFYFKIGRAGRDNKPSKAIMFWTPADRARIEYLFSKGGEEHETNQELITLRAEKLDDIFAYSQHYGCRHQFLYNYFGQDDYVCDYSKNNCDMCLLMKNNIKPDPQKNTSSSQDNMNPKYKMRAKEHHIPPETLAKNNLLHGTTNSKNEIPKIPPKPESETLALVEEISKYNLNNILSRNSVRAIARTRPQTYEALAAIKGVGHPRARILACKLLPIFLKDEQEEE